MQGISNFANFARDCRKVVCIGRNYADHIKELNNARPAEPFFFLKPTTSLLLPGEGAVEIPKGVTCHYEVELAVIIGKTVKNLREEDVEGAMASIAGYAVGIDMTGRNVQDHCKKKGLPWSTAKGFDTFNPISKFITREQISDPHNVTLYLEVNGESKQNDSTDLMLFNIPKLISHVSGIMTLQPNDIIMTGTPKGVGQVFAGDVMTAGVKVNGVEIEEGKLKVNVEDKKDGYEFKGL